MFTHEVCGEAAQFGCEKAEYLTSRFGKAATLHGDRSEALQVSEADASLAFPDKPLLF